MKNFSCPKCGSEDLFLRKSGNNMGLYCGDCGKWIKWVNKNERTIIEKYIEMRSRGINVWNSESESPEPIMFNGGHECKVMSDIDTIYIRTIKGKWYWVLWDDNNGYVAHGIKYCPYCGVNLYEKHD